MTTISMIFTTPYLRMKQNNTMRDYDSWLTSFLDYEDDDGLTDEEREELKDLYEAWVIDQYEQTNY